MQGVLGDTWEKIELLAALERSFSGQAMQSRSDNGAEHVSCAKRKNPPKTRYGALQIVRTGYPMQMVAADIMGPLLTSKNGNCNILVASDISKDG